MARRHRRITNYGTSALACALAVASGSTAAAQDPGPLPAQSVEFALPAGVDPSEIVHPSPQSAPSVTGSSQSAQAIPSSTTTVPITSIDQLYQMDPSSLESLYQGSTATSAPAGKVKGRVLLFSGTRLARPASKVARLMWQGKIFKNEQAMAVNRFFGIRVIKGRLYQGQSWFDGRPALILDYQGTSLLYRSYRDEIREVGPGIYLGLMYSRTQPDPTLKMYFALEATP